MASEIFPAYKFATILFRFITGDPDEAYSDKSQSRFCTRLKASLAAFRTSGLFPRRTFANLRTRSRSFSAGTALLTRVLSSMRSEQVGSVLMDSQKSSLPAALARFNRRWLDPKRASLAGIIFYMAGRHHSGYFASGNSLLHTIFDLSLLIFTKCNLSNSQR